MKIFFRWSLASFILYWFRLFLKINIIIRNCNQNEGKTTHKGTTTTLSWWFYLLSYLGGPPFKKTSISTICTKNKRNQFFLTILNTWLVLLRLSYFSFNAISIIYFHFTNLQNYFQPFFRERQVCCQKMSWMCCPIYGYKVEIL